MPRHQDRVQVPAEAVGTQLREAWLAGFAAAGEGYNGEYPFDGNVADDEGLRAEATEYAKQASPGALPSIEAACRERFAKRLEEVDAGLSDLRRRREREGKEHSASYLQGRQHECRNQAAALRRLHTADLRANRWSDALTRVIEAACSWLVREHGDTRPADDAAGALFDALAALSATRGKPCERCGQKPEVVGYDEHHQTDLVRCGCTGARGESGATDA